MKIQTGYLRFICATCLIILLGLVWISPVQAETTYSGRAFAASVNSPTLGAGPVFISDTDELPSSGGFRSASLLSAQVDNLMSAEVLVASTSGANNVARSSASLANIVALPGHLAQVTASFVRAEAEATCNGVRGDSEVAELTFGGVTIEVTGAPNQTFEIRGVATLIINEQRMASGGSSQAITINALHLILVTGEEVILSSAHSDINGCPPPTGPCHDFVTGGGWIKVGSSRSNFGFNVGFKGGSIMPEVHFNHIDHNTGMKVKATSITVYVEGNTNTSRHFEGSAEINGMPGFTYSIDVTDNGEPGRKSDTFFITLSNGYSAGGTLEGGNIQLHKPCQ